MEKKEARRKRYQRRMARQIKGSNRRKDTKKKLAKVSRKIANVRKDWVHHTTREIAEKCGTVVVEDLKVKNMTVSAKGDCGESGEKMSDRKQVSTEQCWTPPGERQEKNWNTNAGD